MTAEISTCLLILGMHRSGTSCLAGTIEKAGLYMGDVHKKNPFNKKGNRENQHIMLLNEDLLAFNNISWDNPFLAKKLNWTLDHEKRRDLILHDLHHQAAVVSQGYWGFKDPRNLITLSFWEEGLACMNNIVVKKVATFRNPLAVYESLKNRNNFSEEKAIDLWLYYNSLLINLYQISPFTIIDFDTKPVTYNNTVNNFCLSIGLEGRSSEQMFYDAELKHWGFNNEQIDFSLEVTQLYDKLLLAQEGVHLQ